MFQTEFEFTLPMGYLDDEGTLHRQGTMRLATAGDEILPLKDPRVQGNQAYLVVILLSRVITRLGSLGHINPKVVEGLFAADLAYLQEFYNEINRTGKAAVPAVCPKCAHEYRVELNGVGG
ncbi:hypothetical protein DCC79_00325 [bacterium]|nr:phage tail assembly protein [Chloroflexi bacterium CFX6]RIL12709.1 MAG: hypothetical protein DCC79_00325 [bacterium]